MKNTEQDQIISSIAKQMADDIDKELLWGMLVSSGWTRVSAPITKSLAAYAELSDWLSANCKQSYKRGGSEFIFESVKDANWFILRWGCK